jgi:hypothetical protein
MIIAIRFVFAENDIIGVKQNFTSVSRESIFRFNNKVIYSIACCVFCECPVYPTLLNDNPSERFNCFFALCHMCDRRSFHNTCKLPHDNSRKDCPLIKRFVYLLLCFPLLQELPLEILQVIYKKIQENFINYLRN